MCQFLHITKLSAYGACKLLFVLLKQISQLVFLYNVIKKLRFYWTSQIFI